MVIVSHWTLVLIWPKAKQLDEWDLPAFVYREVDLVGFLDFVTDRQRDRRLKLLRVFGPKRTGVKRDNVTY